MSCTHLADDENLALTATGVVVGYKAKLRRKGYAQVSDALG
jgi:hypothetical protein